MKREPVSTALLIALVAIVTGWADASGQTISDPGASSDQARQNDNSRDKELGLVLLVSVQRDGSMHYSIVNDGVKQVLVGSFVNVSWNWVPSDGVQLLGACFWVVCSPQAYQLLEPRGEEFRKKQSTTSADCIYRRAFLPKNAVLKTMESGTLSVEASGKALVWDSDLQRFGERQFRLHGECTLNAE